MREMVAESVDSFRPIRPFHAKCEPVSGQLQGAAADQELFGGCAGRLKRMQQGKGSKDLRRPILDRMIHQETAFLRHSGESLLIRSSAEESSIGLPGPAHRSVGQLYTESIVLISDVVWFGMGEMNLGPVTRRVGHSGQEVEAAGVRPRKARSGALGARQEAGGRQPAAVLVDQVRRR